MIVYIAGKVTGLPIHEVSMKFGGCQVNLESMGITVINPLKVVNDWRAPWEVAMRKCIAKLMDCDAIYIMPCAADSPGAKIELHIAQSINMPVYEDLKSINIAFKQHLKHEKVHS
jgi:hypothetical protein